MIISQTRLKCNFFVTDAHSDNNAISVSYTHLRAHETGRNLVCRLLLEKKKKKNQQNNTKKQNMNTAHKIASMRHTQKE